MEKNRNFRVVPKFVSANSLQIWCVSPSSREMQEIARVIFPIDGQLNDNLACAEELCAILKKRIKKSV